MDLFAFVLPRRWRGGKDNSISSPLFLSQTTKLYLNRQFLIVIFSTLK